MRYWYDTEFIEDGKTIELISIGFVCENGREFYAQSADCRLELASDWVFENVYPYLLDLSLTEFGPARRANSPNWISRGEIKDRLLTFIGDSKPELWGYYSAYDHVALCQLFGTMMDLPKGWPMYTRDLKQWCDSLGNPRLPEQGKGEHHALADARWNKQAWEFLQSLKSS